MKSLRIAIILPGFSASESDWCIPALLDMVRVQAETHQIDVFPMRYPHSSEPYQVYGANVFPQNGQAFAGLRRIPLMIRTIRAVLKQHKSAPYDLIHALWVDEPGLAGVILSRILGVPLCVSVMGGEFVNLSEIGYGHQQSLTARWMTRLSVKQAEVVTVGSEQLLEQVQPYTSKDIQATPLGVDTTRFSPAKPSNKVNRPIKLLTVGSLISVKNHEMLLRAFAELLAKGIDTHLDIAGEGVLETKLKALCNELGLKDQVSFHGSVEHHHLSELYHQADLCVLTSWHESQSMAALEAAACGVATVGTKVGILPELVHDAYLVNPDDHQALSEVLYLLATNSALRKSLNQSVHKTVMKNHTLHKSIERWNRIYTDLATS